MSAKAASTSGAWLAMTSRATLARCSLALFLVAGIAGSARAGGFEIYEQSTAGAAMVGALTAHAVDASTIFYNPAGIALVDGGGAVLGGSLALGRASVDSVPANGVPAIRTTAVDSISPLPAIYLSAHLGDRVAAGIGVFSNFGGGVTWNSTGAQAGADVPFPGRFLAQSTQLSTVTINPTVAMRVVDRVSIGVGFDAVLASLDQRRSILVGDSEGAMHAGGTALTGAFNVGILAELVRGRLFGGLTYRSGYDLDFNLQAHFDVPAEVSTAIADQPATLRLSMPHNFSAGVAVCPFRWLTISADAHLVLWSSVQELRVQFPSGALPDVVSSALWRDTGSARLGVELSPGFGVKVRAGVGYDRSPVPAATLGPAVPDTDRVLVGGGVDYTIPRGKLDGLGLGVSYSGGYGVPRTSSNPAFIGTYAQTVHVVAAAFHYAWGARGPFR